MQAIADRSERDRSGRRADDRTEYAILDVHERFLSASRVASALGPRQHINAVRWLTPSGSPNHRRWERGFCQTTGSLRNFTAAGPFKKANHDDWPLALGLIGTVGTPGER